MWSFYDPRNFGDWISPYLFEAITGNVPYHYSPRTGGLSCGYSAAGSILRHISMPNRILVWGSGIISKDDVFEMPKGVVAVRGPRTRDQLAKLGYPTSEVFGDPGILMPLFYKPTTEKSHRVGFIPHFFDFGVMSSALSSRQDIHVINVCRDVESVINDVVSCEYTLSSSLHGIIISHGYNVPCAWMNSWEPLEGDDVKFHDYFESGGIFCAHPTEIGPSAKLSEFVSIAESAPRPDIIRLQKPLLTACPF